MSDLGNKEVMAENIKRYMDKRGETSADVCRALNIKKAAFSTWVNAKAYPRIDKIEEMARYFRCTKADLVERYDPDRIIKRAALEALFNGEFQKELKAMSADDMQDLLDFARFINSEKYQKMSTEAKESFKVLLGIIN